MMQSSYKYLKIKERALEDRPREKMLMHGSHILSDAELLGLVIGSGISNMTSVDLAQNILKAHNHKLPSLSACSLAELQQFKGIGPAKAVLIRSVLELAQRMQKNQPSNPPKIKRPEHAYKIMKEKLHGKVTEECWLMLLNTHGRLLKAICVSKGGLKKTSADPSVIMKQVVVHNSSQFILVHNHPSGDPNPSHADIDFTAALEKIAKCMGIYLADHLIVTDHTYFSFREEGIVG